MTTMLLSELMTCEAVLVVHTDGTRECDHGRDCGCDPQVHDWWVPCDELGCGCGDGELVLFPVLLPLAA